MKIILYVIFLFGIFSGFADNPSGDTKSTVLVSIAPISITAAELSKAIEDDSATTEKMYEGQTIEINDSCRVSPVR